MEEGKVKSAEEVQAELSAQIETERQARIKAEDDLAVAVIKMVNRRLTENGYFLTCHIHPNLESYFLWHVVNWGMLYRTRWELRLLLVRGGFLLPVLHSEPHRIHSVAVVQKKA